MSGIHTCSYSCERPACIKAQRDELAARILTQPAAAPGIDLEQFRKLSRDMRKFIDNWDTISIDEFAHFSMRLDEMIDASAEREGS